MQLIWFHLQILWKCYDLIVGYVKTLAAALVFAGRCVRATKKIIYPRTGVDNIFGRQRVNNRVTRTISKTHDFL